MKVKHRLPILMATKGIRSVSELARLIGYEDQYKALHRFYNYKNKTLDPELLAAICSTLECNIDDLLYLEGRAS